MSRVQYTDRYGNILTGMLAEERLRAYAERRERRNAKEIKAAHAEQAAARKAALAALTSGVAESDGESKG